MLTLALTSPKPVRNNCWSWLCHTLYYWAYNLINLPAIIFRAFSGALWTQRSQCSTTWIAWCAVGVLHHSLWCLTAWLWAIQCTSRSISAIFVGYCYGHWNMHYNASLNFVILQCAGRARILEPKWYFFVRIVLSAPPTMCIKFFCQYRERFILITMSSLALVGCFALLLVTSDATSRLSSANGDLVTVGYYAESLCPDCIAMTTGPMNEAVTKVIWIIDLT